MAERCAALVPILRRHFILLIDPLDLNHQLFETGCGEDAVQQVRSGRHEYVARYGATEA
jgi:hypothetical protein